MLHWNICLVSHSHKRNVAFRWNLLQRVRFGFMRRMELVLCVQLLQFDIVPLLLSSRNGVMLTAWDVWASQTRPTLLTWRRLKMLSPVSELCLLFPGPDQVATPTSHCPNSLVYPGLRAAGCGYVKATTVIQWLDFWGAWARYTDCFPLEKSPRLSIK